MTDTKTRRASVSSREKPPSGAPDSTFLGEELRRYQIGDKLRALRLRRKLGLVELARHTGLSPALLSKLERGRLIPTLPTLQRIALVFSVDLDHFFRDPKARPMCAVVRGRDRLRFPEPSPDGLPGYDFESLNFPVSAPRCQAYMAEFRATPPGERPMHAHAGAEMVYVLEGRLAIELESGEQVLATDDAIYFDSGVPHRYRRAGRAATRALVFVMP